MTMSITLSEIEKKAIIQSLESRLLEAKSIGRDNLSRVNSINQVKSLIEVYEKQVLGTSSDMQKWNDDEEYEFRGRLYEILNQSYESSIEMYYENFRNGNTPIILCLNIYAYMDYMKGSNKNYEWFRRHLLSLGDDPMLAYLGVPTEIQEDTYWARELKKKLIKKISFLHGEKFNTKSINYPLIKAKKLEFKKTVLENKVNVIQENLRALSRGLELSRK